MNGRSYLLVVFGIFFAKFIGFIRDIFFADAFGASNISDIYVQVFGLVTLVFTGIGLALSTAVIMNLNKEENSSPEKGRVFVSSFIRRTSAWLLLATLVLYLAARPLAHLLLPNVTGEDFELAVKMTYIMLPSFFFVSIAYILSGVLQNSKVFFIPSIVSLPYNIIILATLLVPGVTIEQVGIATTVGWFLHIAIQLPDFYRKGYRFFCFPKEKKARTKSLADMSMWWIFLSNMMFQLCFIIDKASVSGNSGDTSILNYSSNLYITIASVFIVAMSSVVFPSISKNYEEGKLGYVSELIGYIITVMFAVFVPFVLVTSLFGEQVIGLLYEHGEFDHATTVATASAFAIYSFGVLGYVAQELINKVLYLASKYVYTIGGTAAVVLLKLVLDRFFVPKFGTDFAAATTALLLTLYAVMSFIVLRKIIGRYLTREVLTNIGKVLASGAAAAVVYVVFRLALPGMIYGKITFILPLLLCGVTYVGVGILLGLHKVLIFKKEEENKNEAAE